MTRGVRDRRWRGEENRSRERWNQQRREKVVTADVGWRRSEIKPATERKRELQKM